MTSRRSVSYHGRAKGRRRRARGSRSNWPVLLGVIAAIVLLSGWLSYLPWPFGLPSPQAHRALTAQEARLSNAAVPIVPGRLQPARPFQFRGSPAAREQAAECLATAALYESGHDRRGQQAVIQVILNRARQPGFPKTVCGVVYQGAERTTGCQFSFSCDGSRVRRPEHLGWAQARGIARRALRGHVFAPVGRATHYHTDWIVPYWRPSLDKIAQIDTHIFYRRH
jgi:spore germination cell wall hydrolase CwlJ-like protein